MGTTGASGATSALLRRNKRIIAVQQRIAGSVGERRVLRGGPERRTVQQRVRPAECLHQGIPPHPAHALMRPLRMASSYGAVYRFASTRCFVPFQHAICHPFAGDAPVRSRVACDEPAVEPLPLPAYVLLDRHAARHEAKAVRAHACVRAPLILPTAHQRSLRAVAGSCRGPAVGTGREGLLGWLGFG